MAASSLLKLRVVLIAIGGPSSSGKSILAKRLNRTIPGSVILHQDDFAPPESELPYNPLHPTLKDWDHPPTAIVWSSFFSALKQAKETGIIQEETKCEAEVYNGTQGHEENDRIAEAWKEKWEKFTKEEERKGVKLKIVLVDGFLLYWDPKSISLYDASIFLRVPEGVLRKRREARPGYVTQTGEIWKDPPFYFPHIVYPAYVYAHKHMFVGGDVDGGEMIEDMSRWGEREEGDGEVQSEVKKTEDEQEKTGVRQKTNIDERVEKGEDETLNEKNTVHEANDDQEAETATDLRKRKLHVLCPGEGKEAIDRIFQDGLEIIWNQVGPESGS